MLDKNTNILVVDENNDLLDTFSLILKKRGYNVETASGKSSAMRKFDKCNFDVILMDAVTQGTNNVETIQRIKQTAPGTKVILMSSLHDESALRSALLEQVFETVHKPVDIGQLIALIKEAVKDNNVDRK